MIDNMAISLIAPVLLFCSRPPPCSSSSRYKSNEWPVAFSLQVHNQPGMLINRKMQLGTVSDGEAPLSIFGHLLLQTMANRFE